jgi:hypothetical protein
MMTTTSNTRGEPTPLYLQPLRHYGPDDEDCNNGVQQECALDGGYYETVHTLISPSPLHENDGEIETSLQEFVQQDGSVLWRRVVVKSGPSTETAHASSIVHASFLLPDDYHHHRNNSNNDNNNNDQNNNNNIMCWTSFSTTKCDSLNHIYLCVLAHPTLLCIWDVYPQQKDQLGCNDKKSCSASSSITGASGEGHYVPLPFEASGIFAVQLPDLDTEMSGLLIQRCETIEDLYAFETDVPSQNQQPMNDGDDDNDNDDDFVLQEPPRPVRVGTESIGATPLSNSSVVLPHGNNSNNNNVTNNSLVPSLFSLSHPKGDILPVSTQGDTSRMGPVTDVFEKILFVGTMKWLDDNTNIDWWTRREHSQSIAVTYHSQLKR